MPAKKPPTRKQLAARKRFVAMVKARSRDAAAAKRKAGYKLRAGKWIAPKAKRAVKRGKRNPLKFGSEAAFGKWQQQAKKSSGGSVSRSTAKKSRVTIRKRKQKVGALGRLFSGSGRLGLGRSRTSYSIKRNPVSVTKNGRKLYGAAAQAVLASRASKKSGVMLSGRKRNPKKTRAGLFSTIAKKKGRESAYKVYRTPGHVETSSRGKGSKFKRRAKAKGASFKGWSKEHDYARRRKLPNGIFRTAARAAIGARLSAPVGFGRKKKRSGTKHGRFIKQGYGLIRNSGAPADIQEMHEKFLGRPSEDSFDITAPQGTPKDVAVLGSLVCLKTEDEDFDFEKGEAFLGADGRGNLYVLGDTTPVETNENFGHIEEIRYEARKDHINPFRWKRRKSRRNSSNVEYFHYFGEEDGVMPKLKSDSDGLLHISGGNYKVEAEGIIN